MKELDEPHDLCPSSSPKWDGIRDYTPRILWTRPSLQSHPTLGYTSRPPHLESFLAIAKPVHYIYLITFPSQPKRLRVWSSTLTTRDPHFRIISWGPSGSPPTELRFFNRFHIPITGGSIFTQYYAPVHCATRRTFPHAHPALELIPPSSPRTSATTPQTKHYTRSWRSSFRIEYQQVA